MNGVWVCVDVARGVVDAPERMESIYGHSFHYVIAFDQQHHAKDVTERSVISQ